LQRLEEIEERAHARLMRAIESGNPFQVKACQEFYLRCSETLRRLDLAVETERRTALEQIPMRQIENARNGQGIDRKQLTDSALGHDPGGFLRLMRRVSGSSSNSSNAFLPAELTK
jgi:hypothetical protein